MVSPHPKSGHSPSSPLSSTRYELITIGDELLLGLTANSHLTFLGTELARRGLLLQRNVVVTDEADAIARQFRQSWEAADVVITTGGLGPTCDDRTREAIAEVLGQKLVFDPSVEKAIRGRFALFGRQVTSNNLKQAYRFERSEVIPNSNGTAPGLWVDQDGKILVMLPGPPNELQPMFVDQIVPKLVARRKLGDREAYVQIRTAGVGESMLETQLQPIFDRFGDALSIAFCAHAGHVDCRLSAPNGALPEEQLREVADECAHLLGDDFVCFGHDSLAKVCADLLRSQEKKLAVSECATGGMVCDAFNDLCGASKFFAGGCICHSNDARIQLLDIPECLLLQHGAVSCEAAVAMATGAAERLGADYALAITGFAGPCGGTKANPIGTIHLALHAPHGIWSKTLSYPGPRRTVKVRVVNAALDWLRRELLRASRGIQPPVADAGILG